jgi:hypothetical protein
MENTQAQASGEASSESSSEALESQNIESQESQEGQVSNTQESKAAAKEAARLRALRLKVDGREIEEELPFEIPDDPEAVEYMTRQLQMARMGSKRAQEYAQLEKEIRQLITEGTKNPRKLLKELNIDEKELARAIIEQEIENSQKSPEQLEKERIEEELRMLKEEREREKQDFERKEFERLQEQAYERYDTQMSQALEKSDLPKEPYVVKKIADYMLAALQQGYDVSPDDVIPLVRDEIKEDLRSLINVMPDEALEQFLGKEVFNRFRKKNLAKAKEAANVSSAKAIKDTGNKASTKEPEKKVSFKDFFGI